MIQEHILKERIFSMCAHSVVHGVVHGVVHSVANRELQLLNLFEDFLSFWQAQSAPIDHYFKQVNKARSANSNDIRPYKDDFGQELENEDILKQLHKRLIHFIEQQKIDVAQFASASQAKHYQALLYAMAALVDELILQQLDWEIKSQWLPLLMELKLFKSRNAGDELIERMKLFAKTSHSLTQDEKQLAHCYLRILWLGFDGKYKEIEGETEQIKAINKTNRNNLQSLIENLIDKLEENEVMSEISQLFKDNVSHNINPINQSRLAPINKWKKIIFAGFTIYFFVALIIWHLFTYELGQALEKKLSVPSSASHLTDSTKTSASITQESGVKP